MTARPPTRTLRAVVVHRPTDYELLIEAHATRGQAEFFLRSRGQTMERVEQDHTAIHDAITGALGRIPARWRRTSINRAELSRFLFEPDDVILAVGQDGLVANVAKYLEGQLVVGVNPLPKQFEGSLVVHDLRTLPDVLGTIDAGRDPKVQERTMVEAKVDDGQTLVALNEVFVGHRSHQSARYRIGIRKKEERQSSSGLICCTGTGASGWGRSIHNAIGAPVELPAPVERRLCFFVREAWPSKATGTAITTGDFARGEELVITSEMNQGGVIFGDGIEDDYLPFDWGRVASIGVSARTLRLVS